MEENYCGNDNVRGTWWYFVGRPKPNDVSKEFDNEKYLDQLNFWK